MYCAQEDGRSTFIGALNRAFKSHGEDKVKGDVDVGLSMSKMDIADRSICTFSRTSVVLYKPAAFLPHTTEMGAR